MTHADAHGHDRGKGGRKERGCFKGKRRVEKRERKRKRKRRERRVQGKMGWGWGRGCKGGRGERKEKKGGRRGEG